MIDTMTILELKENIYKDNEVTADSLRSELTGSKKLLVNLMSSPGSGKTTTLLRTIEALADTVTIGVLECDINGSVDARISADHGAKAGQLHTGGMCHMDARMTKQGLEALGIDDVDLIFLENVGNLVCPAEFDTGAPLNVTILSVPEGDDKPAKYPLIYEVSDAVLINKTDAECVFDFSRDLAEERIRKRNPKAEIFYISAREGTGIGIWADYLRSALEKLRAGEW